MTPVGESHSDPHFQVLVDVILAGLHVSEVMQQRLPSHDGHGLGLIALSKLASAGRRGLPQVELARLLGKPATSATRLIDGLEAMNMVARGHHAHDRRIKIVTLTPEGQKVLSGVLKDLADAAARNPAATENLRSFKAKLDHLKSFSDAIISRQY